MAQLNRMERSLLLGPNLHDLPLEILDIILHKSYLHWILYSTTKQIDEEVIRSLASVDVCFSQRITRRRVKKAIWRHLKEYKPEFGGEWPLTANEVLILDTNRESIVDLLDLTDLLWLLLSRNVINRRQMDSVSSKSTSQEKAERLLEILRRRSLYDYKETIACLHETNQSHIAEILHKGGAIVRIHVTLFGDEVEQTEAEIISRFKSVLISKTAETKMQHLITDFHIIAVEKGHGVVLYVHCISLNDLVQLREMQITGDLKTLIERMFGQLLSTLPFSEVTAENLKSVVESVFTQLLHRSQIPSLTVTLSEEDYQKCRLLFPGDIKLRAVVDFGPIQMSNREEIELGTCVQSKIREGDAMLRHYERLWLNRSTMFYSLDTKPLVLSFEKGDRMETFSPANIGFYVRKSIGYKFVPSSTRDIGHHLAEVHFALAIELAN